MFQGSDVLDASGNTRTFLDIFDFNRYQCCLRSIQCLCTKRLEIYQCVFFCKSLRFGAVCIANVEYYSYDRSCIANVVSWFDDGPFLCVDRYDLRSYAYSGYSGDGRSYENYAIPFDLLCNCRFCFFRTSGIKWFCCRNDSICRSFPMDGYFPQSLYYHCLYLHCNYGCIYPSSSRKTALW